MNAAFLTLFLAAVSVVASAQKAPAQKVVFLGDATTFNWGQSANSSAFPANPKWIDKGLNGRQTSAVLLARFQSDVVSQKPAIVHILAGAVDISTVDDANRALLIETFQTNLMQMVAEANHANIQVILGTIPPQLVSSGEQPQATQIWQVFEPTLTQAMNAWIESYGAQNHIPVVNYHDLLCSCVGSTNPAPAGTYPLMATSGTTPSASGYAVMSTVVTAAITNLNLSMNSGFVQATPQTTSINEGNTAAFTAYGVYSDGIPRALLNTNFAGMQGTWGSSNTTVLFVGYNGVAFALSPGQASVTFTALNGVVFTPAAVTVNAAQ